MPLSKKHKEFLVYTFLWLIAVTVGINVRLYPLKNFSTDETSTQASLLVLSRLKAQVTQQVELAYPQRSAQEKEIIAKKLLAELIHKEKAHLRESINKVATELQKSGRSPAAKTYLLESDPFLYYGLTENILNTGKMSEQIKGSKYFNELMLAPKGHWEPLNLHPYVGYYLYQLISLFNRQISLMTAVSFTPLIITGLALIIFFLIGRLLNCHPITIFTASIFFVLAPILIKRSAFGWYDNDPYSIFFLFLILYCVFCGLKRSEKNLWPLLKSSLTVALALSLYALFWQGWMFIFTILIISAFIVSLYNHFAIKDKIKTTWTLRFFLTFILMGFLGISLLFGWKEFFVLFQEGWHALKNFLSPQLSPWPDLYITVGELHKAKFGETLNDIGGKLFFIVALLGAVFVIIRALRRDKDDNIPLQIILVILFGINFILASGARRFGLLLLVPASLCFLLGLQYLYNWIPLLFKNIPRASRFLSISIPALGLLCVMIPIKNVHDQLPILFSRIYNTTWDKTMQKIFRETPPDSIINAWWPPGHFIKGMAKRHVTFDGATINVPQAYWMSNVFLAKNENDALGILRMLNTSANDAADYLQEIGFSLPRTVNILKEITKRNESEARLILNAVIRDQEKVDNIILLTHRRPPPSYLLIYKENVDDHIQFDFIGNWNFSEIEKINTDRHLLEQVPPRNSPEYVDFMWKLAGGQTRFSGPLAPIAQTEGILYFDENVSINLSTYETHVNSDKYGHGIPYSIFYLNGNTVDEKRLQNSNLSYSIMLTKDGSGYKCILLDRSLAQSLLIQLYYFEGKGMNYLELFSHERELTQDTDIYVFRINWDKFLNDRF